jgi:hypothetical protein
VKVQEVLLARSEPANIDNPFRVDAHSLERGMMSDRRDDESAVTPTAARQARLGDTHSRIFCGEERRVRRV